MEENDNTTIAMQFMLKLNEYQQEIIKSMNYIRGDIHELKGELKGEVNDLRQELRDYKEENNRRLEENEQRWKKYEEGRRNGRKFLLDKLEEYNVPNSEQSENFNV